MQTFSWRKSCSYSGHRNSIPAVSSMVHQDNGWKNNQFKVCIYRMVAKKGANSKLWDPLTGQLLHTLTGHSGPIYCVKFHPYEQQMLASSNDDGTIALWKVPSMKPIHTLTGHLDVVLSVTFSSDGNTLAS